MYYLLVREVDMDIQPKISLTSRLSLRDFDTELWRLYFCFLKGLLLAVCFHRFIW